MLTALDRYLFRTALLAFLVVLISLTGIIWTTQALGRVDLVTNQGQSVLVFLGITLLIIPALQLVIVPFAFVIAVVHTIDRLHGDSEIVVMSAAGMAPWRLFRPFLALAIAAAVVVGSIGAYVAPRLERERQERIANIRADLVSNIVRPGQFVSAEGGLLTFHIRERRYDGTLLGILLEDRRTPGVRETFTAAQGSTTKSDGRTFLLLEHGTDQRVEKDHEPAIVLFDRYAFDLSQLASRDASSPHVLAAGERYLWQLFFANPDDPVVKAQPGRLRAELHDRLLAPIYPLAFLVLVFALIGTARTTRQSRLFATALALLGVLALRLIGFACIIFAMQTRAMLLLLYGSVILTLGFGVWAIHHGGVVIDSPRLLARLASRSRDPAGAPAR